MKIGRAGSLGRPVRRWGFRSHDSKCPPRCSQIQSIRISSQTQSNTNPPPLPVDLARGIGLANHLALMAYACSRRTAASYSDANPCASSTVFPPEAATADCSSRASLGVHPNRSLNARLKVFSLEKPVA